MITNYKSFATTRNREVAELSLAILAAAGDQWERRVRGEDQPIGRLEWVGPCYHYILGSESTGFGFGGYVNTDLISKVCEREG